MTNKSQSVNNFVTKYGYTIVFNNQFIDEDIEVFNEDGRLVCAFTKKDIENISKILDRTLTLTEIN